MPRRLIAIIGMLALAVAFLPAAIDGWGAPIPECCYSGLCPMHHAGVVLCDMAKGFHGTSFEACPSPAPHYLAALAFVRVAPPALSALQPAGSAPVFTPPATPCQVPDVAYPPPRAFCE